MLGPSIVDGGTCCIVPSSPNANWGLIYDGMLRDIERAVRGIPEPPMSEPLDTATMGGGPYDPAAVKGEGGMIGAVEGIVPVRLSTVCLWTREGGRSDQVLRRDRTNSDGTGGISSIPKGS